MGLIKKFSALLRSNLNTWLDQAENPQKLADLAMLEAEHTKKKAQALLIKAQGAVKLGEDRIKILRDQLINGAEEQKIQPHIAKIEQEQSINHQTVNIIKNGLKALDNRIKLLQNKTELSPDHVHDTSAFDTFSRIEEKIESSEAQLAALKELFEAQNVPKTSLEEELDALKKKLHKKSEDGIK